MYLILGCNGLLGHSALLRMNELRIPTMGTVRGAFNDYFDSKKINKNQIIENVYFDRYGLMQLEKTLIDYNIRFVVNCIGCTKKNVNHKSDMIYVNSYLPHKINEICSENNIKYINISTDCVFSGSRGNYKESDSPDPVDSYGLSKLAGEPSDCLNIRTSFIGHEINTKRGLLEWFLSQDGNVNGYTKTIWNGFTARHLTDAIFSLSTTNYIGTIHVGGKSISKHDLLVLFKKYYKVDNEINPLEYPICDRSLNSEKFQKLLPNFLIKTHDKMIEEMINVS